MRCIRLSLFVSSLALAGLALANGETRSADGNGTMLGPVQDTTYRYFPQVSEAIEQEPISPRNPKLSPGILSGPANSLSFQSTTSSTQTQAGVKFPGMTYTGFVPPDPNIAVGPQHIVQVVNVQVAFFDKSGNKQFQQSLGSTGFFYPIAQTTFVFDPKVIYDQGSQRFFIIAVEQDDNPQSSGILLAVSDDNNPNGNWTKYRINTKVLKSGVNYWYDYPGLGYNKDGLVITGNMFSFANNFGFSRSYAIKKAGLLAGGVATFSFFDHMGEFTIQPARTLENVSTRVYGVRIKNTTSFSFYAWSGIAATPSMTKVDVAIPAFIQLPFNFYAQSTGGGSLDALSDRMMDAAYRSGYLVCAHTVAASAALDRSMVRWYEFSMGSWPTSGSPTRRQSGNIVIAAPNNLLMPAISRNGTGGIALIVTRCSTTRPADLYGTSHRSTDPLNSMGPLGFLASSGHAPVPQSRWGDYHSMATDPSSPTRFWACGEVLSSNGQWRTEISTWIVP